MKRRKLYIAYGSNMNKEQMKKRCPNAIPVGTAILENYKLEFRGVANIIKSQGSQVPIALWEITDECEIALDRYEGYPRLYGKKYIMLDVNGKRRKGMVYVMNLKGIAMPNMTYFHTIKQGYKDFKIDDSALKKALAEALYYTEKKELQKQN